MLSGQESVKFLGITAADSIEGWTVTVKVLYQLPVCSYTTYKSTKFERHSDGRKKR